MNRSETEPAVPLPTKRREVLERLRGWAPEGASPAGMDSYLRQSAGRLLHTARELARLPRDACVLEIGANPYFLTVLMRTVRPDLNWVCTNWHGESAADASCHATVAHAPSGRELRVEWHAANVEQETLPFADAAFDAVAYCEVLEHLVQDPARSLEEIHRVTRRGGLLLLTTPNPARVRNIRRLLRRKSIHDAISGYGIYGRHNREYDARELAELLRGVGFDIERSVTIETSNARLLRRLCAAVGFGEHHLVLARKNTDACRRFRPRWLYRDFLPAFHGTGNETETQRSGSGP